MSVALWLWDTDLPILKCNYSRAKSLSNGRTLKQENIEEIIRNLNQGRDDKIVLCFSLPDPTAHLLTDWLSCSVQ